MGGPALHLRAGKQTRRRVSRGRQIRRHPPVGRERANDARQERCGQQSWHLDSGRISTTGVPGRGLVARPNRKRFGPGRAERRAADREQMREAVEALRTSEGWQRWLDVRRHFHTYSFHSQLMIALQCPEATRVAGFRRWLELGYVVEKGEKAIRIGRPVHRRIRRSNSGAHRAPLLTRSPAPTSAWSPSSTPRYRSSQATPRRSSLHTNQSPATVSPPSSVRWSSRRLTRARGGGRADPGSCRRLPRTGNRPGRDRRRRPGVLRERPGLGPGPRGGPRPGPNRPPRG
jgi:hypothetical protein